MSSKITNIAGAVLVFVASLRSYQDISDYWWWAATAIGFLSIVNFISLQRISRDRHDLLLLLLPSLFLLGLFGTIGAISFAGTKLFVAVFAVFLLYFYQQHFPKAVPVFIEEIFTLSAAFLVFNFLWSVNFFFTPPWWGMIGLVFVFGFLLFWQAFYKIGKPGNEALLQGLLCGLLAAESAWAILFLPVHFLTASVVSFMVFYVIYVLSSFYFAGRLTSKKIYFQLGLVALLLVLSLVSSPWQPIR